MLSIQTLLAVAGLLAPAAPASTPAPADASFLDEWGTLVVCAGGLYFETGNTRYGLGNTGTFQAGDVVYVIGVGGPSGVPIPCPNVNEVISANTISSFDPIREICPCDASLSCTGTGSTVGCLTSSGSGASLGYDGMPSVGTTTFDLDLEVRGLPGNQSAIVFMSQDTSAARPLGDGLLCIGSATGGGLHRFALQNASSSGRLDVEDVAGVSQSLPAAAHIAPGSTWNFQVWFRDPSGPCGSGFNTTNGLQVTFFP